MKIKKFLNFNESIDDLSNLKGICEYYLSDLINIGYNLDIKSSKGSDKTIYTIKLNLPSVHSTYFDSVSESFKFKNLKDYYISFIEALDMNYDIVSRGKIYLRLVPTTIVNLVSIDDFYKSDDNMIICEFVIYVKYPYEYN